MDFQGKNCKITAVSFMKELCEYEKSGTRLYVEDVPCKASEVVQQCMIAEDVDYMRDFICRDSGQVAEIHFIRLRNE